MYISASSTINEIASHFGKKKEPTISSVDTSLLKFSIGIYVDLSHKGHSENQRSYVSYSEPPLKICEEAEEKNSVN